VFNPVLPDRLPPAPSAPRAAAARSPDPAGAAAFGAAAGARLVVPDWAKAADEQTSAEQIPVNNVFLVFITSVFARSVISTFRSRHRDSVLMALTFAPL
jgi:hypothetical protein